MSIEPGTPVRYWPGIKYGPGIASRTRSEVWHISGVPVVAVEGYPGGIALTHVEVAAPTDTTKEN